MSKMSELALDIQDHLERGWTPERISDQLGIPLEWVLGVLQSKAW